MNEFLRYTLEGIQTIADFREGAVHLLFMVILCSSYKVRDWKKVLIQIVVFTLGYSLTFFLSGFKLIDVNTELVKALMPVTILVIAAFNLLGTQNNSDSTVLNLSLASVFGFIHGLEYYTYYKGFLQNGLMEYKHLLLFNFGLVMGQVLIMLVYISLLMIFAYLVKKSNNAWHYLVNGTGLAVAMLLIFT